jgi:hypothetical protein
MIQWENVRECERKYTEDATGQVGRQSGAAGAEEQVTFSRWPCHDIFGNLRPRRPRRPRVHMLSYVHIVCLHLLDRNLESLPGRSRTLTRTPAWTCCTNSSCTHAWPLLNWLSRLSFTRFHEHHVTSCDPRSCCSLEGERFWLYRVRCARHAGLPGWCASAALGRFPAVICSHP